MVLNENPLAQLFFSHRGKVSDKWEHYLFVYNRELAPLVAQNKPLRLLEIGVQNGGSLELWNEYLPQGSEIVGVDIEEKVGSLRFHGAISAHVADASSISELTAVLQDRVFDIIVDDGSHRSDHIIATFKALYPRLAYGGKFIVEDVHASYWRHFGGGLRLPSSAVEFFKNMVDAVNADHFEPTSVPAAEVEELRKLNRSIAAIKFYDSMIIVEKLKAAKVEPYRRMLTGVEADVLDPFVGLSTFSANAIEKMLFSEEHKHRIENQYLDWISGMQDTVDRLRNEITCRDRLISERDHQIADLLEEVTKSARDKAESAVELEQKKLSESSSREMLINIQNSTSWRITQPLRAIAGLMRRTLPR